MAEASFQVLHSTHSVIYLSMACSKFKILFCSRCMACSVYQLLALALTFERAICMEHIQLPGPFSSFQCLDIRMCQNGWYAWLYRRQHDRKSVMLCTPAVHLGVSRQHAQARVHTTDWQVLPYADPGNKTQPSHFLVPCHDSAIVYDCFLRFLR